MISGLTQANESVFWYANGLSHANYSKEDFIPKFLEDADPAVVENATTACGGADKVQCIFDLVFTDNVQLALSTEGSQSDAGLRNEEAGKL